MGLWLQELAAAARALSVPGLCAQRGLGSLERGRWVLGDGQQVRNVSLKQRVGVSGCTNKAT